MVRIYALTVLACLAMLSIPCSASAAFSPAQYISPEAKIVMDYDAAVDSTGTLHVASQRVGPNGNHRIQYQSVTPTGVPGPTYNLSLVDRLGHSPSVGVGTDDTVHIAWIEPDDSSYARVRDVEVEGDGEFTAVRSISPGMEDASGLVLEVDSIGTAHLAWVSSGGGDVVIKYTQPDLGLNSVLPLSIGGAGVRANPAIAIDANRSAHVAWTQVVGADQTIEFAQVNAGGGSSTAPVTLSAVGDITNPPASPQIAVTPSGIRHIAWHRTVDGASHLESVAIDEMDNVSPISVISSEASTEPLVLIAPSTGPARIAWNQGYDVATATIALSGTVSPLTTAFIGGTVHSLAFDSSGNGHFGIKDNATNIAIHRSITPAAALSAPTPLSLTGQHAYDIRMLVGASNIPQATWLRSDGTVDRIQHTRGAYLFADASPSPSTLTFADTPTTGPKSFAEKTIDITNAGTGPLDVSNVQIVGGNVADFRLISESCTSTPVAPTSSCTVRVSFDPRLAGPRSSVVRVSSPNIVTPVDIPISGLGIAVPDATLSSSIVVFGMQSTASASPQTLGFSVNSIGGANLAVSGMSISGADADSFAVHSQNCTQQPVAPSESCTITMSFTPKAEGTAAALVTLTHNVSGKSFSVALIGIGTNATTCPPNNSSGVACQLITPTRWRLTGSTQADRISAGPGADVLIGDAGDDRMDGNAGADHLTGGSGRDILRGGSGNDYIDARDRARGDVIDCGPGRDIAIVNPGDRTKSCEIRRVRK